MKVLIVEPGKYPREENIPHTLKAMQEIVGGWIAATYPWSDPVALVCDDEGLLKGYALNRRMSEEQIIAGTFFLCGVSKENFADLPDGLMAKYKRLFHSPEVFLRTKTGILAIPLEEELDE